MVRKYGIPDDLCHLAHGGGWRTEFAALAKVSPGLKAMKAGIFYAVMKAGSKGLTPDEFCKSEGLLINTVRRRFTDMWKEGIIRHHPLGLNRPNAAGNDCVAWVIGRDPKANQGESELVRLRLRVAELEKEVALLRGQSAGRVVRTPVRRQESEDGQ